MSADLFARPTETVTLKDGATVKLQAVSNREYDTARRNALVDGERVPYLWDAHLIMAALVDPKPDSIEQVLDMPAARAGELALEVLYVSELAERPEAIAAGDAELAKEAGSDPLVEEFPAADDESVEGLVGADGAGEGVRDAAAPAGSGAGGDVPDDGRGPDRAPDPQPSGGPTEA